MTTRSQQTEMRRWLLPFLAALIAALAAILLGTTASASATVGAETRVGAFNVTGEVLVGPPEHITAVQRLGETVPGPGIVVATGVAANSGMAGVRATGATGEAMAGIVKNTTRIPSASGKAAYRIPDELNSSVLGEVKNVKSLGWSSQISDMYAYSSARGLEFTLYVRPSTVFRGQLAELYKYGGFTRVDVPGMGP